MVGAPTHGGLPALMDASASQELWRHARSNILIINPAAPPGPVTVQRPGAGGRAHGRFRERDRLAAGAEGGLPP